MPKHNIARRGICCVFIISITIASSLLIQNVYAFTYESQDWWFAQEQQEAQPTGELGIIFTYPDRVIENDTIDVNARIEYMDNEDAQAEYVILDNVTIHVRNNDTRLDGDISNVGNETSPILMRGQYLIRNYSVPSQDLGLQPGNLYAIDLSFTVKFVMKTKVETYYWDSGEKFGNSIEPQDLGPFQVVDKNGTQGNELTLRVSSPFGRFKSVDVLIDDEPTIMEGGAKTIILGPGPHTIKMDDIPLVDVKGQQVALAHLTSWSDGVNGSQRVVNLNKNTELFAIYTTQYLLNITSKDNGIDVIGKGWYDSGSRAQFSVGNLSNDRSFTHWTTPPTQDVSAINPTSSSNFIDMDGPKSFEAQSKQNDVGVAFEAAIAPIFGTFQNFFAGFVASAILGPVAGFGLSILYSYKEKKRNLIYLNTYLTMINDILRQNIREKDVCFTLLDQKRKEIIRLLQAGIINIETFRVLNERIAESFKEIFDSNQK